jgi:hypothetical protein
MVDTSDFVEFSNIIFCFVNCNYPDVEGHGGTDIFRIDYRSFQLSTVADGHSFLQEAVGCSQLILFWLNDCSPLRTNGHENQ